MVKMKAPLSVTSGTKLRSTAHSSAIAPASDHERMGAGRRLPNSPVNSASTNGTAVMSATAIDGFPLSGGGTGEWGTQS